MSEQPIGLAVLYTAVPLSSLTEDTQEAQRVVIARQYVEASREIRRVQRGRRFPTLREMGAAMTARFGGHDLL